jgi:hypothetical protein
VQGARGGRGLDGGHRLGLAAAGLIRAAIGADVAQVRRWGHPVPTAESAYYDQDDRGTALRAVLVASGSPGSSIRHRAGPIARSSDAKED